MIEKAVVRGRTDKAAMVRVSVDNAIPFKPLVPNAETIEAMKAARCGDLFIVGEPSGLLACLNADC